MTQFLFNNQNLLSAYPFFLKNLDIGQAMNEIHTSIFHFFTGVVMAVICPHLNVFFYRRMPILVYLKH